MADMANCKLKEGGYAVQTVVKDLVLNLMLNDQQRAGEAVNNTLKGGILKCLVNKLCSLLIDGLFCWWDL